MRCPTSQHSSTLLRGFKRTCKPRETKDGSNTKHELPMQVSVGSPVVPRNCHQCTRPDWGLVTADTSVVRAVCGPAIIFPELSVKNKDELMWGKASACPPSSSTSFLFAWYSHEGGWDKNKLVATADNNPWRDLPSWNFLSSPAISRHILVSISISSWEPLLCLPSAQKNSH